MEKSQKSEQTSGLQRHVEMEDFGHWMIVKQRQRRKNRLLEGRNGGNDGGTIGGSRFDVLSDNHGEDSGILELEMIVDLVGVQTVELQSQQNLLGWWRLLINLELIEMGR
ncbi:hypothetical protein GOBAR_DD07370 [Gossypium barbadense]|nr:hypothetical protein GOBAR_DD07370 [Gossypium barbadense]